MASKRKAVKPESASSPPAHDEDEKALDPKLAEQPDEDLDQTSRRPTKRYKGTDVDTKDTTQWHRSDFNPAPKGRKDNLTPLKELEDAVKQHSEANSKSSSNKNVLYWMRMKDLRVHDNRALARASKLAQENGGHLIALHVISPGDFHAHDRSPRRIDFVLRALRELKKQFEQLDIPFVVVTVEPRTAVVDKVLELCAQYKASNLTANYEYEVDELWRDTRLVKQADKHDLSVSLLHDCYVVPPGRVLTNDGRPYSVFSPWNRKWTEAIGKDSSLIEASPDPKANDKAIHSDSTLGSLFDLEKLGDGFGIPDQVKDFECSDSEYMAKLWPVAQDAPRRVLDNFMKGKGGRTVLDSPADEPDAKDVGGNSKESRLGRYSEGRNLLNENGTSRISPYLAAGLVSPRECLRRTKELTNNKLTVGRDSGAAMWNTEISFRDFYGHVLAAWPKVCMGHAFISKYENVVWEYDDKTLNAWKEGLTGYPIVDAAQRQCFKQGYIHNRGRMISAMFLTKHLLHDWREGERHFSRHFIDQDFASNNGGWQWSASTGTDPQPYFRIFNPLAQSEKSDPQGDYIRHFVPELKNVKGKAIHDPFGRLSKAEFAKLGYPEPIVEHKAARERALRRYKNPGDE